MKRCDREARQEKINPKQVEISHPAQADLVHIYTYIAQDDPVVAERFIEDLVGQMYKIAELGLSGAPRDWIRPGLRAFPYRQRCIYFRVDEDRVVIVRVLHGSQDVGRQEFPEND